MRIGTLFALSLPAIGLCADGLSSVTLVCATSIGSSSRSNIPTTTTTQIVTKSYTVTSIQTPTITVTPPVKTALKVLTSTTTTTSNAAQQTKVFTSSTTMIDYSITSTTATFTSIQYSTVFTQSTITPTAAPPAAFTPLGDAIAAQGQSPNTMYLGSQPSAPNINPRPNKRRSPGPSFSFSTIPLPTATGGSSLPSSFPQEVVCNQVMESAVTQTLTKVARAKTITAVASTTSVTSTRWLTKTSVIKPKSASSTTTTTLSITLPITTTTSTTTSTTIVTTQTNIQTAPTVYPVCNGNNFVTGVNGSPVWDLSLAGGQLYFGNNYQSAQQCCIDCQMSANCGVAWLETLSGKNYCLGMAMNTCDAGNVVYQFGTMPSGGCAVPMVLMNTKCGKWSFQGQGWQGPDASTGYVQTFCPK